MLSQQWRWSSFGNYYIHDIEQKTTYPLVPPTDPSRTAYAAWSPTGNAIAYVLDNDLYLRPSAEYGFSFILFDTFSLNCSI